MALESNPNGGKRVTFALSIIVSLMTICGLAISGISYVVGYRTASGDMAMLIAQSSAQTIKIVSTETTVLLMQKDIDYIKQIVAELKLAVVPKR